MARGKRAEAKAIGAGGARSDPAGPACRRESWVRATIRVKVCEFLSLLY